MSKTNNRKNPQRTKKELYETEVLTKGKLIPIVEDLKDFIKSTANGTENVLRKEINKVREGLELTQHAVSEHTRMIKGLESEMHSMEGRLSNKIDNIGSKVENHEYRLSTVEEKLETHLTTH